MSIRFHCECGQQLSAQPKRAGRKFTCPKCNQQGVVPSPAEAELNVDAAADQEFIGKQPCKGCEHPIADDKVLCLKCGYHKTLKRKVNEQDTKSLGGSLGQWFTSTLAEPDDQEQAEEFFSGLKPRHGSLVLLSLVGAVITMGVSYFAQMSMRGPAFIVFYAIMLAVIWFVTEMLRTIERSYYPPWIGATTFAALGVSRIFWGVQNGMERFGFLFTITIGGMIFILAGVKRIVGEEHGSNLAIKTVVPIFGGMIAVFFLISFEIALFGGVTGLFLLMYTTGLLEGIGNGSSSGWFSSCGGGCGGGGCGGGGCGGGGCGGCGG